MEVSLFRAFRDLAYQTAGITLRDGKESLVSARIARRMRELGLEDARDYLELLRDRSAVDERVRFVDAITTNFTSFFRERDHFSVLESFARGALARGSRRFRVWCAAAATGEEPYTIAMTLAEAFGSDPIDSRILATDISTRALAAAKAGRYRAPSLASVPPRLRQRYFSKVASHAKEEQLFAVSPALRRGLVLTRLNLATPPFPMRGPFDAILCRNVMIYFDRPVRAALVAEAERLLRPGGLFFVGHSETLSGVTSRLAPAGAAVYRKPEET